LITWQENPHPVSYVVLVSDQRELLTVGCKSTSLQIQRTCHWLLIKTTYCHHGDNDPAPFDQNQHP